MKILMIPAVANRYDQIMNEHFAVELRELGAEVHLLLGPVRPGALRRLCLEYNYDVVFRVNSGRSDKVELPKNIRHVSWFQDFHYITQRKELKVVHDDDIIYFLGDAGSMGLRKKLACKVSHMYTGVIGEGMPISPDGAPADYSLSLAGFIPPPRDPALKSGGEPVFEQWLRAPVRIPRWIYKRASGGDSQYKPWRHAPGMVSEYQAVTEAMHEPLSGSLDVYKIVAELLKVSRRYYPSWLPVSYMCRDDLVYFSTHYPRMLDRLHLVRRAMLISSKLVLFGPGWNQYPEFAPFAKGVIQDTRQLYRIFQKSRLNLANNTHGLGLHSRTLECMHAGGVIMMHTSPHDNHEGGMHRHFEPNVHYISFDRSNFEEVARKWLRDADARRKMGIAARAIVLERHQWRHRAKQLLDDLK